MSRWSEVPEEQPQYAEEVEPWSYEAPDCSEAQLPRQRVEQPREAPGQAHLQLPPAMPPREAKRRRLTPLSIGLGTGAIGCFALAVGLWARSAISQKEMAELSPIDALVEDADLVTEDHDGLPLTDEEAAELAPDPWEGAQERYPGLAAWLEVEGTGISTPVMQAEEDAPDWFLNHDAFGDESASGLPYLDFRCSSEGNYQVIYAHNLGWGSSEGFGALSDAWQQDVFDGLGPLRLAKLDATGDGSPKAGRVDTFTPVCSLKIDGDEPDPFDFAMSATDLPDWLDGVIARSDARADAPDPLGFWPYKLLALVTCSGDGYPSQSRTIVLFSHENETIVG